MSRCLASVSGSSGAVGRSSNSRRCCKATFSHQLLNPRSYMQKPLAAPRFVLQHHGSMSSKDTFSHQLLNPRSYLQKPLAAPRFVLQHHGSMSSKDQMRQCLGCCRCQRLVFSAVHACRGRGAIVGIHTKDLGGIDAQPLTNFGESFEIGKMTAF